MFYPFIKPHISPSAFDAWHNSRGNFVRSYFEGIKTAETASMRAGKQIHALAEAGILDVKKHYEHTEQTLTVDIEFEFGTVKVLGIPDSHESAPVKGNVSFVDYKSGKEQTWSDEKLATDLKMKMTAWLVWRNATLVKDKRPKTVTGYIEYIPTRWDAEAREVVPTEEPTILAGTCVYTAEEMSAFEGVILSTILDINKAYPEWQSSTDEFIDRDDVTRYAELAEQVRDAKEEMDTISERLAEQMQAGSKDNYSSTVGTFYFRETKKWDYPEALAKKKAVVASEFKKFETENAPVEVNKSLSFRAKK